MSIGYSLVLIALGCRYYATARSGATDRDCDRCGELRPFANRPLSGKRERLTASAPQGLLDHWHYRPRIGSGNVGFRQPEFPAHEVGAAHQCDHLVVGAMKFGGGTSTRGLPMPAMRSVA